MIPDTVTPRTSTKDQLRRQFEQQNWWARHPLIWLELAIAVTVASAAVLWWKWDILVQNTQTPEQAQATLVFLAGYALAWIATIAIAKYFFQERPWRKFYKTWNGVPTGKGNWC